MAYFSRLFAVGILLTFTGMMRTSSSQTIGEPPANLTMKLGSPSAMFNCTGLPTDTITWYIATPTQTKLFTSPNTIYANQNKYQITAQNVTGGSSYSLTVMNLALTDGDSFGCDRTSVQIAFGHLVVVQTPTASVQLWNTNMSTTTTTTPLNALFSSTTTTPTPSTLSSMSSTMNSSSSSTSISSSSTSMSSMVSSTTTTTPTWIPWNPPAGYTGLSVGSMVSLSCQVLYAAPTADLSFNSPISWQQDPQLQMFLGNQNLTPPTGPTFYQAFTNLTHIKNITVNYTIQATDVGSMLQCYVNTVVSSYNDSYNMSLNINGPTTAVTIGPAFMNPMNTTISLGSNLTCSANGYPPAYVVWQPLMSNLSASDGTSAYGNATLVPSSPGQAWWNCTALNQSRMVVAWQAIMLTVVGNTTTTAAADDNSLALGLGLGLGIGIPVLIAIIILIVFLHRKKKDSQSGKKSEKQSLTSNDAAASAASRGPTAASQAAKAKPSVNQNPNPYNTSYNAPLLTEPNNQPIVRESPGYADLGVRQMVGGGSIPVMNDSFDSNANRSFQQGGGGLAPPTANPRGSGTSGASANGGRMHSPSNHSSEV